MGWFWADRRPRPGEDPYLRHKVALFTAGTLAAVLGIALERDWLVTVAIVILAIGILLRVLPRRGPPEA